MYRNSYERIMEILMETVRFCKPCSFLINFDFIRRHGNFNGNQDFVRTAIIDIHVKCWYSNDGYPHFDGLTKAIKESLWGIVSQFNQLGFLTPVSTIVTSIINQTHWIFTQASLLKSHQIPLKSD